MAWTAGPLHQDQRNRNEPGQKRLQGRVIGLLILDNKQSREHFECLTIDPAFIFNDIPDTGFDVKKPRQGTTLIHKKSRHRIGWIPDIVAVNLKIAAHCAHQTLTSTPGLP